MSLMLPESLIRAGDLLLFLDGVFRLGVFDRARCRRDSVSLSELNLDFDG